jgi:hypothetical protein
MHRIDDCRRAKLAQALLVGGVALLLVAWLGAARAWATGPSFYLNDDSTSLNVLATQEFDYGDPGNVPLIGDWNGDGVDTLGAYAPSTRRFGLKNTNASGFGDIPAFDLGNFGDIPLAGDWNGDGTDTVGAYRPSSRAFCLNNQNATDWNGPPCFDYGDPGAVPLVGDWDGNGTDTIGVYMPSARYFGLKNSNSSGFGDIGFTIGDPGDIPIAGDWNGDGTDTIGVYRPSTRDFFLLTANSVSAGWTRYHVDAPGNTPIVGDFDGDGRDEPGMFEATGVSQHYYEPTGAFNVLPTTSGSEYGNWYDQPLVGDFDGNGTETVGRYDPATRQFFLRNANSGSDPPGIEWGDFGDVALVGDWDGNGTNTIGAYRPSQRTFYLRNSNSSAYVDYSFEIGNPGDIPIVGDWDGNGTDTIGIYRPSARTFYLKNEQNADPNDYIVFEWGDPGEIPIAGDWDDDGKDSVGLFIPATQDFWLKNINAGGDAGVMVRHRLERSVPTDVTTPLAGDWNGDGKTTIGLASNDRTPPAAAVSGGLYDARNAASLTDGSLSVTANDNRGGVHDISLLEKSGDTETWISGRVPSDLCASGTCPLSASWTYSFNPVQLGWATGVHHLIVEVIDAAGNRTRVNWDVNYYATSWTYGGANRSVDTSDEVDAVRTALGDNGYLSGPVWEGLSPADRPGIYLTSWTFGGADHLVNSQAELSSVAGPLPEFDTLDMWNGLVASDQQRVFDYFGMDAPPPGAPATDPDDDDEADAAVAHTFVKGTCPHCYKIKFIPTISHTSLWLNRYLVEQLYGQITWINSYGRIASSACSAMSAFVPAVAICTAYVNYRMTDFVDAVNDAHRLNQCVEIRTPFGIALANPSEALLNGVSIAAKASAKNCLP